MELINLVVLAFLGFLGGVLSGVAGVGGGVIFIPALVYAAHWGIKEAIAASLVLIFFAAFSGTFRNFRSTKNPIDWKLTAFLAVAVAPSTLIGVAVSRISPDIVLEVAFAILLLILAYPTARGGNLLRVGDRRKASPALVLVAGVGIGTLAGLLGVGGGVLLVPLMVLGLGVSMKRAISTSLAVILFASLTGAMGYVALGMVDLASLPPLILGSVLGGWVGAHYKEVFPDYILRWGFAGFMVLVAMQLLLSVGVT